MEDRAKTIEYYPCKSRGGSALMVVLILVMAITIISFGFLARSDMELACAANVPVKMQMDYLAESGLEHARSVLVNPQDADTSAVGYWQGGTGLQIAGGSDYYDLIITGAAAGFTPKLTYDVDCTAYRLNDGDRVAQSRLTAKLRMDPFIAYSQGTDEDMSSTVQINGDVWAGKNPKIYGAVNGDVFSAETATDLGSVLGDITNDTTAPVGSAGLVADSYNSSYYYDIDGDGDGDGPYTVEVLPSDISFSFPAAGANNPAKIYYCDGNLHLDRLTSDVTGTLVVKGNLELDLDCSFAITPYKNMPAAIVNNEIRVNSYDQQLTVNGYCQVGDRIDVKGKTSVRLYVNGALFIGNKGISGASGAGNVIVVNADPVKSALETWSSTSSSVLWSPAGGSFFKQVDRAAP